MMMSEADFHNDTLITLESDESKPEVIQTGERIADHPAWLSPDLLRRTRHAILSHVEARTTPISPVSSANEGDELEIVAEKVQVRPRSDYMNFKLPKAIQKDLFRAMRLAGFTQKDEILAQLRRVMDLIGDPRQGSASSLPSLIMSSMVKLGQIHWHQPNLAAEAESVRRASWPAHMTHLWTDNRPRQTKRKPLMPQKLIKPTAPAPISTVVGEITITPVPSPENGSGVSGAIESLKPVQSLAVASKTGAITETGGSVTPDVLSVPKLPPSQPVSPFQNSFQAFLQSPTFQKSLAQISPSPVEIQPKTTGSVCSSRVKPGPKRRTKSASNKLAVPIDSSLPKMPVNATPKSNNSKDLNNAVTVLRQAAPKNRLNSSPINIDKKRPSQRPQLLANNEFMKKVAENSRGNNKKIKTLSEILKESTRPETLLPVNLPQTVSSSCEPPAQPMPIPPAKNTLVFNLDEATGLSDLKARLKEIQDSGPSIVPETRNPVPSGSQIVPTMMLSSPSLALEKAKFVAQPKKQGHVKKKQHSEKNCQKEDIACFIKDLVITTNPESRLRFVSVDIFHKLFSDFSINLPQLFNVIRDLYPDGMDHFQFQGWSLSLVSTNVAKVILESLGRIPQALYDHFCAMDLLKPPEVVGAGDYGPSKTKIHEFNDRLEYLETLGLCTVQRARELTEAIHSSKRSLRSARRSSDQSSESKSRPSSRASEPEPDLIQAASLKNLCSGKLKPMFKVNGLPTTRPEEPKAQLNINKETVNERAVIKASKSPVEVNSERIPMSEIKDSSLPIGWTMIRRPRPGTAKVEISYESPTGRRFASLASALNNVRKMQEIPMTKSMVNESHYENSNSPAATLRCSQTKEVPSPHLSSSNVQDPRAIQLSQESTAKSKPQTTVYGIRPARKFAGNQIQLREEIMAKNGSDDSEEEPKKKKLRSNKRKRSSSTEQQQEPAPEFQLAGIKLPPQLEAGGWFTSKIAALKYVTESKEKEPRGATSADYKALELEDEVLKAQLLAPVQTENKKDGRILVKHWGKTVADVMELRQWRAKIKARRKELTANWKEDHRPDEDRHQLDTDVMPDASTKAISPVERLKALYSHLDGVSKCSELPPGWAKRTRTTSANGDLDSVELEVTYVHKSGHQVETPLGAWQHFHHANIKNQSEKH